MFTPMINTAPLKKKLDPDQVLFHQCVSVSYSESSPPYKNTGTPLLIWPVLLQMEHASSSALSEPLQKSTSLTGWS